MSKNKMKPVIYLIELNRVEDDVDVKNLSKEDFIKTAKKHGIVYNLEDFEIAFNNGWINEEDGIIRIYYQTVC